MFGDTKHQIARLLGVAPKQGYSEVDEINVDRKNVNDKNFGHYNDEKGPTSSVPRVSRFWKIVGIASLVGVFFFAGVSPQAIRTRMSKHDLWPTC